MSSSKTGNKLTKKLEKFFLLLMLVPLVYMANSWFQSKKFKDSPLPSAVQTRIQERETQVVNLIRQKFNVRVDNIPLIVSDEFSSRLYGLTAYKEGEIAIYLNKKRFKESENYMIEEVIPHEYAHAMVFILGEKTSEDGHTALWQKICKELDGKLCERYVDGEEIIRQKMNF